MVTGISQYATVTQKTEREKNVCAVYEHAQTSVIGPEKEELMEASVMLKIHWVTIKKPLSIMENV